MTKGGGVMVITDDRTTTLRANMKHHEPIILEPRSPDGGEPRVYENGIAPTLNTYGGGQRVPCIFGRTDSDTDVQHEQSDRF